MANTAPERDIPQNNDQVPEDPFQIKLYEVPDEGTGADSDLDATNQDIAEQARGILSEISDDPNESLDIIERTLGLVEQLGANAATDLDLTGDQKAGLAAVTQSIRGSFEALKESV